MATPAQDFTDQTLERTPEDATCLLSAIAAVPEIRTILAANGMTNQDIVEGRNLLMACLAAASPTTPDFDTDAARRVREAIAELDAWDEPNFARYQAALARHFPAACEHVFQKLSPSRGVPAVQGVATFLKRIDALEQGTDPARSANATRKEDKQAVALLEKRGLTTTERKRLTKLIEIALGPTPALEPTALPTPQDERRQALLALKLWYNEWATVAHATIRKRTHLIRLGLANRRAHKEVPESEPDPVPTGGTPPTQTARAAAG